MSKRFTDTEKWNDKWFRELTPIQKIVFVFFCDRCDIAGFYEIDLTDMEFRIGESKEKLLGAIQGLNRGYLTIKEIKDGTLIWIKNFIKHQKNLPLNPDNNAHRAIINSVAEHFIFKEKVAEYLGADQGLFSPIGKGIGKGIDKKGSVRGNPTDIFKTFFSDYHSITGLVIEYEDDCFKEWRNMKSEEQQMAMKNIQSYFNSLDNKKYTKSCLAYLRSKIYKNKFKSQDDPLAGLPDHVKPGYGK